MARGAHRETTLPCRALAAGAPTGNAKNGDTHVTGVGVEQTIDCNGATLLVDGTRNTVNALGTCWAVTLMGSGHTVVADNVVHDITVNRISQVAG